MMTEQLKTKIRDIETVQWASIPDGRVEVVTGFCNSGDFNRIETHCGEGKFWMRINVSMVKNGRVYSKHLELQREHIEQFALNLLEISKSMKPQELQKKH